MERLLNKSTKGVWFILCFVLLLSIVGCCRQDGTEKNSASGETANPGSGENITIGTDWKTAGFSYPERELSPSEDTPSFQEIRGSVFEETKPEFN